MFLASQIKSCYSQRKDFEKKDFLETVSFTVSASFQTSSVVYVARYGFVCALFFLFFLYYTKAIDEEICPSGFRNCYV